MPKVVGPGSIRQDQIAPSPSLEGATEFEYVTILNPLTDDFQVMVAQDIPVNMPFQLRSPTSLVQSERDVTSQYGLQLKNPDHTAHKYIYNQTIIPAGKTMNFKGNEAQVVVKQLVNEILQREGQRRLMADPTLRKQVEDRIIVSRGTVQDILDKGFSTPSQQIDEAMSKLNEVSTDEPFPGLNQTIEANAPGIGTIGDSNSTQVERTPGRPAKVK